MEFYNNYSAAFIGPCNALGLGELEDTIRPCTFTIGSENIYTIVYLIFRPRYNQNNNLYNQMIGM